MRIVAHNGAQIWGGAERATVMLLEGLAGRGHSVKLLCNSDVVARNAEARGIESEICVIGGDVMFHHALRLGMTLRRLEPDAFIIGTFKKLFLAGLGARIAGVDRVIARVGLETDTPRSAKYRYALRHWIDHVAVNAERMVTPFAELDGFARDRISVIWNGVRQSDDEEDANLRAELGIPPDAFVVGTVARLAKQKRLDRLIEAIALVPDVHCIIAGEGTRRPELTALIAERRLADRVHLLGHRTDTLKVLRSLDVFVISSDTEGLSNSMLEAMSTGIPVVSTNVSGASDALAPVSNGQGGLIVDFAPGALANAIVSLKRDPATREAMGRAAQQVARSRFSMDVMLDRWEAILNR